MTMTLTVIFQTQRGSLLVAGLRLAVDKVIHHDDVIFLIIIRPRGHVASCNPDPCDAGILKHDAEERKAPIARRGRNETAEQKLAVRVEVLHQRAGLAVSLFLSRPGPIRPINVCEDRAEATDRCWVTPIGAGHEEQSFGAIDPYRSEQPRRAEGAEGGAVRRVVEKHFKAALGPARCGSLRKAYPGCGKLGAASVQEHVKRRYRVCRGRNSGVTAVPVDLAATACERKRPWVIHIVVIYQSGAKRLERPPNRVGRWPCRLEHNWRIKILGCFALRVRGLVNWDQQRHEQQANREYVT